MWNISTVIKRLDILLLLYIALDIHVSGRNSSYIVMQHIRSQQNTRMSYLINAHLFSKIQTFHIQYVHYSIIWINDQKKRNDYWLKYEYNFNSYSSKLFYFPQETISKSLLWSHPINAGNDKVKISDTIGVKLINDKSKHCESPMWKVCNFIFSILSTQH